MPEFNLGKVRAASDYDQNDTMAADYIANRPCYLGRKTEVTEFDNVALTLSNSLQEWPGPEPIVSGDSYDLTINSVTVKLTGFKTYIGGVTVTGIGDNYHEFVTGAEDGSFTPVYGFSILTFSSEGVEYIVIITDGTGDVFKSTFGLTDVNENSECLVTLVHEKYEDVKTLDPRLLPNGLGENFGIKVVSAADPTTIDFSQFEPGTIVMVIQ